MPAIMILGFDLELTRVMLVAVLGGLLGILMMIPLRRALIVQQHGFLKYPEGTACAEVLKAGASDESRAAASHEAKADMAARHTGASNVGAKTIFTGFGIGILYQAAQRAFFTWKEAPEKIFGRPTQRLVGVEVTPPVGVATSLARIASIILRAAYYLTSWEPHASSAVGRGLRFPGTHDSGMRSYTSNTFVHWRRSSRAVASLASSLASPTAG